MFGCDCPLMLSVVMSKFAHDQFWFVGGVIGFGGSWGLGLRGGWGWWGHTWCFRFHSGYSVMLVQLEGLTLVGWIHLPSLIGSPRRGPWWYFGPPLFPMRGSNHDQDHNQGEWGANWHQRVWSLQLVLLGPIAQLLSG